MIVYFHEIRFTGIMLRVLFNLFLYFRRAMFAFAMTEIKINTNVDTNAII